MLFEIVQLTKWFAADIAQVLPFAVTPKVTSELLLGNMSGVTFVAFVVAKNHTLC